MGRTMRRVLESQAPESALLVGYSGAAGADLQPGDLIIATDVLDASRGLSFEVAPDLVTRAEALRRQIGLSGRCGPLVTVTQAALSPEAKAAAGQAHQALALDLESAAFAGACRDAGLPYLVVRAILDPWEYHLPEPVQGQNPVSPRASALMPPEPAAA